MDLTTVMSPDVGDQLLGVDIPCSASMIPVLSGMRLTGTPSAMAAATFGFDAGPDDFWIASEVLRAYADDNARRAMADLRTFIDRCPTVTSSTLGADSSYRFAVAPGSRQGDDSIHVSCSSTSGSGTLVCDSILIRIGTTLVAVKEQGNNPGGDKYLTQLTEAALRTYQTSGS